MCCNRLGYKNCTHALISSSDSLRVYTHTYIYIDIRALRLLDCLQADLATGTPRLSSPVIEKFKAFWQAVLNVFGFGSSNSELIGDEWQYIYTTKPEDGSETVCNRRRNRRMLLQPGCAVSGKEETAVTVPGSEKVLSLIHI